MPTLHLTYRTSTGVVREIETRDPVVRMGREPSCEVLFDESVDRMVSRNHAELRWEDGRWMFVPTPGKMVFRRAQELIGPVPVASGDVFEFAGLGGPSIAVRLDGVARPPGAEENAPTVMEVRPLGIDSPPTVAPPRPAAPVAPTAGAWPAGTAPPGGGGVPADPSSFTRGPISLAPKQVGTEFLQAVDAAKLLSMDAEKAPVPVQERSRTAFRRAVIVGIFVVVSFASFAGGWVLHTRIERRRLAVQRVLDLLSAQASNGLAPDVSPEDLALFQEAVKEKIVPEPVNAKKLHVVTRKKGQTNVSVVVASDEPPPALPDAVTAPSAPAPPANPKEAVRAAFADYMRAQTIRLSAGTPRTHAAIEEMKASVAHVKAAEQVYEQAAKLIPPPGKSDAVSETLLRTLRQLGECDALAPPRFLADAKSMVQKISTDLGLKKHLMESLKRAEERRYGPTITAALADQGLPVELFFVPYRESGFDERFVGLPISDEIPKGMWALLPSPATAMGIKVGPLKASLDADPGDDRQHYTVEVKKVASGMRNVFLGQAGGSTLLFMATWSNGDTSLLASTKKRAGIKADDSDPARVNFWKVYESGITDDMLHTALEYVATVAIAEQPSQFGFSFTRPLEHVSLADKE